MSRYLEWKKRALLMASSVFWLPPGLPRDAVLGAYQFKGVGSEAVALSDLSGNGRDLTKIQATLHDGVTYPIWNTSTGYYCRAGNNADGTEEQPQVGGRKISTLNNDDLNHADIQAAVVCFADMAMDWPSSQGGGYPYTPTQIDFGCLVSAGGSSGYAQLYACTTFYRYTYSDGGYHGEWTSTETPGLIVSSPAQNHTAMACWGYGPVSLKSENKASGVVGGNFVTNSAVGSLYVNGVLTGVEEKASHAWFIDGDYVGSNPAQGYTFGSSRANKSANGNIASSGCVASKYLIAAAFYNCHLTAEQHQAVANAMLAL